MTHLCKKVWVTGKVQGVGFRYFTQLEARALQVQGYAKNLADGRVEVHVQGDEDKVERLCLWLHHGPPASRVDDIVVEDGTAMSVTGFKVM